MKRSSIAFSTALLVLLLLPPALAKAAGEEVRIRTSEGFRSISVEVARSPQTRSRGLMFHPPLTESTGMYFVFERVEPQVFWMKNVTFPLDILFIDPAGRVVSIARNVPPCAKEPCPLYRSGGAVLTVLELKGGWCDKYGVREGGKVEYRP